MKIEMEKYVSDLVPALYMSHVVVRRRLLHLELVTKLYIFSKLNDNELDCKE